MTGDKNKNLGFSLIELLVAVSLFVIIILIASSLFIASSKAQKRVALSQRVQADARLVIGTITERVRSTTIDYTFPLYAGGIPSPTEELALIDQNGNTAVFALKREVDEPGACPSQESSPCISMSTDGGVTWNSLTSEGIRAESLSFYVRPEEDPFSVVGQSFGTNIQPNVTLVLGLQTNNPSIEFRNLTFFQTSVVSRVFKR